ncbi:AraC family transcriptional regulator [Marinomonas transparens]|uniref:AraC family transcriptional regulator n=1 Tax=Marinomonas transparens TaxID=2795388 RepID=A0A934JN29_9GAMM|nr:AraC family transcriptional regulator [Marinomonas transparens]MBJ7537463.1 AraC family transcriptional regulator [Marinomonas transparens]
MKNLSDEYDRITQRYQLHGKQEMVDTEIPGVSYFHSPNYSPRTAVAYEPGIAIIGTGKKTAYLDDKEYQYYAGQHLLLTIPLILECETFASEEEPLQGFFIKLDLPSLGSMVRRILHASPNIFTETSDYFIGVEPIPNSDELIEIQCRLLDTLQSPLDAEIIGKSIIDEFIYRLLLRPEGKALFALVQHTTHFGNIAKTIELTHNDLTRNYTVRELAEHSGMSISSFHRAFKQVTNESPLQYIKKMKLFKAKTLIIHEGMKISLASQQVGYESVSQFSREFKRLFHVPPSQSNKISYAEVN